jgi:hypothetical protein
MKLYDYAARGRPIVSTPFANAASSAAPPHLRLAGTAAEVAVALEAALAEPPAHALGRRAWAESQRWEARWPAWRDVLFAEVGAR